MKSNALTTMLDERNAINTGRRPLVSIICPAMKTANKPKKAAIHPFRPLIRVVFPRTMFLSMHLADKLQAGEKRSMGMQIPASEISSRCKDEKAVFKTSQVSKEFKVVSQHRNLQVIWAHLMYGSVQVDL